jgi:hypothetical protein
MLAAALGLAIAGVLAVWAVWPRESATVPSRARPHDDLVLLPAAPDEDHLDAGRYGRDLLAATPSAVVFASARDGTVATMSKPTGPRREIGHVGGTLWAMAATGDFVWVGREAPGGTGRGDVVRLPIAGGAPAVVASGLGRPHDVACDGRWLYVVDEDTGGAGLSHATTIERFPAGGGERVVVGRSDGEVANVALDGAGAYWADALDGTIVEAPIAGGSARVLARERGLPSRVVVAGGALYWVEKRSESLWTLPKAGGLPRQVAQDFAGFAAFVVVASDLLWVNESAVDGAFRVFRVPIAGGDTSPASPAAPAVDTLATDGTRAFWTHEGTVDAVVAAADPSR